MGALDTARVLGYPVYFLTILGSWKVLGGIVLLVPLCPRPREWAYAGIFFNMTGAAASHAFCSDYGRYAFHVIVPGVLALAALTVASCVLASRSNHPGVLLPAERWTLASGQGTTSTPSR